MNNSKENLLLIALDNAETVRELQNDRKNDQIFSAERNYRNIQDHLDEINKILFNGDSYKSVNDTIKKIKQLKDDNVIPSLVKEVIYPNVENINAVDIEAKLKYITSHSFSDSEITKIKADAIFEGFQKGLVEGMVISREEIKNNFPIYNFPLRGKILKTLTRLIKQTLKEQNAGNS